ncbi:hypothetical protein ACFL4W_02740 [Planctomycetota bacterium]
MKLIYIVMLLTALISTPSIGMPIPSQPAQGDTAPAYSGGAPMTRSVDHEENIAFIRFMAAATGAVMLLDDTPANDWYGGFLVGMVTISFIFD